jgi:hypothetical protein
MTRHERSVTISVLNRIASYQDRRDEAPNQELARDLAANEDQAGIREIAENLWRQEPNIRSDCLKVLYEIGYLKPEVVAPYAGDFLKLLRSRNNRLVWGAMIALSTVAGLAPEDRHRILNPAWFEDYSADFPHRGIHACTYIDGETVIRLPLGKVYVEVSSPVMVDVAGAPLLAAADAVTILEQIEGALAYLDTVGTRADDRTYKRMRLALAGAHRSLHNRMHQAGHFHGHTPPADHAGHHG